MRYKAKIDGLPRRLVIPETVGPETGSVQRHLITFLIWFIILLALYSFREIFYSRTDGHGAKTKWTRADIAQFTQCLDLFRVDNGRYPTTAEGLGALAKPPLGLTNWHQYIDAIPLDIWNHPYVYECPGQHLTNSYDLYSLGPDGVAGTDDDISNWKSLPR